MAMQPYSDFTPSLKPAPPGTVTGPMAGHEFLDISLYLKPRALPPGLNRDEIAAQRALDHAGDIALIQDFAAQSALTITAIEPARRLIRLRGTADAMQTAFQTTLELYRHEGHNFRGRVGCLALPCDVAAVVEAVLGLDTRKIARRHAIIRPRASTAASFLPNAVAKFYDCPPGLTGAGQCIALIELGGGYRDSDTKAAFSDMGLNPPDIVAVNLDGGANKPSPDDGADGEVALDIQVAGGVAPGAKLAVYFTVNTDAGFIDAITAASQDRANNPSIISISWGGPESSWTAQSQAAMTSALADAAKLNISVFVAAGDNLATDGLTDGQAHVDFPAASPFAIGCGGTLITVETNTITAEHVWNEGSSGTGGGISAVYPVPDFQAHLNLPANVNGGGPGRGVPDVAGNADPNSGYVITVNGQREVVGGTSAVAPFWAGLTALINQNAATPAGFFLPTLYSAAATLRDITQGNNKPSGSTVGYDAGPGWDACTGLGVPVGTAMLKLFLPPGVS
ncbi:MAG: S53 family peptidase [Acidocella sp.]|nr:S53 family peptidase [Acidocella sp.]